MIKKTYILLFLILALFVSATAQHLQNHSFEGVAGAAKTPEGWISMGQASSPDTQPGAWKVTTPASHGDSYISMVCRGFSILDNYLWEACYQPFNNPLLVGEIYHYSINLAHSSTFQADTVHFNNPVNLRVWGVNQNQEKEILWESGAISNTEWKTFYFDLNPSFRTEAIVLEAYYVNLPKYNGNILIDNLQYYPKKPIIKDTTPPLVLREDTFKTDNIFHVKLDGEGLPIMINERPVTEGRELLFKSSKLTITVWDNRLKDGDIISLFMNEKNILKKYTISKDRFTFDVKLAGSTEYYLTLYAHNLGRIPPNTVAIYIGDGQRKKLITLSSDLKTCGSIKIKIEEELVGDF